ncbi:MAG: hypothetical protein J2P50_15465 [Hyphomicrobiaceae bacterium]|nr:hypothetical protein [Hyphomicrobiaceae bacterium]
MIDLKANVNCGHPSGEPAQPQPPSVAYTPPDLAQTMPVMWPYTGPALNVWWALEPDTRRIIHAKVISAGKSSAADLRDLVARIDVAQRTGGSVEAAINEWGSE